MVFGTDGSPVQGGTFAMWFFSDNRRNCLAASVLVLILLLALAPESQAVERMRVRVGDTTGAAGQENSVVTVFLNNTFDDISAFTLHLILTRNDIANFQTELDTVIETTYWKEWCWRCTQWNGTTCVDSALFQDTCAVDFPDTQPWDFMLVDTVEAFTGNFDTVGTLISGWEMVESRSVSTGELGLDIKMTAIADRQSIPGYKPPIHPQQGGVLFKLLADIFPIPDTQLDREVGIVVDVAWKPYFVFSTPAGVAIGWISVPVPDTNYYMCENWDPTFTYCSDSTKVHKWECPDGICDFVVIDTVQVAELDTTQVRVINGKLSVLSWICGDCNGDGNPGGDPTLGDIMMMVDHIFINGTPIIPVEKCNLNCSTESPVVLTLGDIMVLVDRLFITGKKMCCE
jgi:hypothetical protein